MDIYKHAGEDCPILDSRSVMFLYIFNLDRYGIKGTVHEKPFFPGKGALGPSKYESGKKNPDQNQARG